MAKIEITLTPDYVGSWGYWEGFREIIQNALDGKTEFGGETVIERKANGSVWIENTEATLPPESLLLGFSTKRDKPKTVGQFGEGLKLGILALVRKGFSITIHNGGEIWHPTIEKSEKFNSEVLVIHTKKSGAKAPKKRVAVEVKDVDADEWEIVASRILDISGKGDCIPCSSHGELLLDPRHSGKVYVKGIYVGESDSKSGYGFNLRNAAVDRDRKMVSNWDLEWAIGGIFNHSIQKDKAVFDTLWRMLEEGDTKINGFQYHVGDRSAEMFKQEFYRKYGENAVFVRNMAESREAEHFGKVGIVVSEALNTVLKKAMPAFSEVRGKMAQEVAVRHGWSDLTVEEKFNLTLAVQAVALGAGMSEEDILNVCEVVTFKSNDVHAIWREGKVYLSRDTIGDPVEALHSLAHEMAHFEGGDDGSTQHVQSMGKILAKAYVERNAKNHGGVHGTEDGAW